MNPERLALEVCLQCLERPRLHESGQVGAVKVGKLWRIPASELPGYVDRAKAGD